MKTKLFLAAALFVAFTSCKNTSQNKGKEVNSNQTEQTADTSSAQKKASEEKSYLGTFEGILPAADCEGIYTCLSIHEDTTYDLATFYLGKTPADTIKECGVYHLLDNQVIELVTPSSNNKTYYKVTKDAIVLADKEGTVNQGELAEHYILKKKIKNSEQNQ